VRLTHGAGFDAALECEGTDKSIETSAGIVRAGGTIGTAGVPLYAVALEPGLADRRRHHPRQ
jgi:alcohol dehydrogenase